MQKEQTSAIHIFDIKMPYQKYKEMHIHNCHEFFITLQGTGEQYTQQSTIKMKEGDVFFFPTGMKHIGNGAPSGNCIGGVINVKEKLLLGDSPIFFESEKVLQHFRSVSARYAFIMIFRATRVYPHFSLNPTVRRSTPGAN